MECVQSADFDAENGEIEQQGSGLFEEERGENHPARVSVRRHRAAVNGGGASAASKDGWPMRGTMATGLVAAAPATATIHLQQAAGAAISSATGAVAPAGTGQRNSGCGTDDDDYGAHQSVTPGGGGSGIVGGHWSAANGSAAATAALAAIATSMPQAAVSGMAQGRNRGSLSGLAASVSGIVPQV